MNKLKWNSNQNAKRFIHEHAFEIIVCEMASILSHVIYVYRDDFPGTFPSLSTDLNIGYSLANTCDQEHRVQTRLVGYQFSSAQ